MRVLARWDPLSGMVWWQFRVDEFLWRKWVQLIQPLTAQMAVVIPPPDPEHGFRMGVVADAHNTLFSLVHRTITQDEVGRMHHQYDEIEPLLTEMRTRWENLQRPSRILRTPHGTLSLDRSRPLWMGVVNVTPDSFYADSRAPTVDQAVQHALQLYAEGADIIDIGGQSTRPGSEEVSPEEEWKRIEPVLRTLRAMLPIPISVDTYYARVADRALQLGADIINDVTAGTYDPDMLRVAKFHGVPIVLMHYYKQIRPMPRDPIYANVLWDVAEFLMRRIDAALAVGLEPDQLIIDPGIGFGKRPEHNLTLIHHLGWLRSLGMPILLGPSRKSFIQYAHEGGPEERLEGTLAACIWGWVAGADILRVHDIWPIRKGMAVWLAIQHQQYPPSMPWKRRGWI